MNTNEETNKLESPRSAQIALWGGIAFSVAFNVLIWWAGRLLVSVPHLPDQGASWYYWKLPMPTFWTRLTSWGFYALHQISFWTLIYIAQTRVKKYSSGIHPINLVALGMNAFFILLHFVQTQVWYDGIAQDVSIFSSQASVILMLVAILLMENQRRGLFYGKSVPFNKRITSFVKRYHGYIFAWATVYTFWYHPMENTFGHLAGFLYMFLLLLQGSLFFTRVHLNKWWKLTQEVSVAFHGTLVAVFQGFGLWPMFAFGFAGIFILTQMHGLGWSKWVRGSITGLYIAAALFVYNTRGWVQLNEIVRIPFIEYLAVFIMAGLIGLGIWVYDRVKKTTHITAEEKGK
jgi:hypothetical protein